MVSVVVAYGGGAREGHCRGDDIEEGFQVVAITSSVEWDTTITMLTCTVFTVACIIAAMVTLSHRSSGWCLRNHL